MSDGVPVVPVAEARRGLWDRVSVVWLVPVAALVVALGVAWQNYSSQGPVLEIVFDAAAGVTPNETELRYRDVTVGLVESVRFTSGLDQVIVAVRIDSEVADFVDAEAQFWVVRPEVTTQGISGLETVLSGVFIEGSWDANPGEYVERVEGLNATPLLTAGEEGLEIAVRSTDGSITSAMPIFYKGVQVGEVGTPRVSIDGLSVEAQAVIYAPYDSLVSEATRFWDTSGFELNVTGAGAGVEFDNLTSLLVGGIAFDTFVSGAVLAEPGQMFNVYLDQATARDSVFVDPGGPVLSLLAVFRGNAAGLATGATVELDGLRIGQVTAVNGLIDEDRFGDPGVRLQTVIAIQPSRLGLEGEDSPEDALTWLRARVEEGLRARLATGNLLTGSLKVQLLDVADAQPAEIDLGSMPYPQIPIAASDITDVTATAQGTLARIDALPVEELLESAISFLDNAAFLAGSAETRAVPADVRALLGDLRGLTGAPEVQALPGQVSVTLGRIDDAVMQLNRILAQAEEADAVGRVLVAIDRAGVAVEQFGVATEGLPALIARLDSVAAQAEVLDLGELQAQVTGLTTDGRALLAEVSGLASDGRALLAQPGVQGLPDRLGQVAAEATAAIAEARTALAEVDAGAIGTRVSSALLAAEEAAASVEASVAGVPALVTRIDALAATANGLPLDELVTELTSLAENASTLVSSPSTQALPADLSAALSEAEALLREAREGGVVANANATLQAARDAAAALPGLVERANALLDQAGTTVAGFDGSESVVREAEAAIREVTSAAGAIADLARAIERDPNSLIFGD